MTGDPIQAVSPIVVCKQLTLNRQQAAFINVEALNVKGAHGRLDGRVGGGVNAVLIYKILKK